MSGLRDSIDSCDALKHKGIKKSRGRQESIGKKYRVPTEFGISVLSCNELVERKHGFAQQQASCAQNERQSPKLNEGKRKIDRSKWKKRTPIERYCFLSMIDWIFFSERTLYRMKRKANDSSRVVFEE